jgi:hypothetical protein
LRFFPNYCAGVSPLVFDEMLHLVKFSLCVDFLCTYVLYLVLGPILSILDPLALLYSLYGLWRVSSLHVD